MALFNKYDKVYSDMFESIIRILDYPNLEASRCSRDISSKISISAIPARKSPFPLINPLNDAVL